MPIRSSERARYPREWPSIAASIRARAGDRCECVGECGLHTTTGRCVEVNRTAGVHTRGRIVLTVAHLNHVPEDCDPANLRAMCQRCHLRYDRDHHARNAAATRAAKLPQMRLFP